MTNKTPQIVCFGEVLWDVFPDKKVIGGAPLNVALRLNSLGQSVAMISKVGNDTEGKMILNYIGEVGLPVFGIQKDSVLKTGEVLVIINGTGSATYVITEPVAWDAIEQTQEAITLAEHSQIFIYGSLISRQPESKGTLERLLRISNYSVFDVNLRPPFYSVELILNLMQYADFVKMNDEELIELTQELNGPTDTLEASAEWFMDREGLKGLCVTKGANGAILLYNGQLFYHDGYRVKVADTVGAGDSFLAALVSELLVKKSNPVKALDFACKVGALVASKSGANCEISEYEMSLLQRNH